MFQLKTHLLLLMKTYKMGPEERMRRGLAGREWAITSDEAGFTAANNGSKIYR